MIVFCIRTVVSNAVLRLGHTSTPFSDSQGSAAALVDRGGKMK